MPGVLASRIRLDASGEVQEVHLDTAPGADPEEVARAAESALANDLNLSVAAEQP